MFLQDRPWQEELEIVDRTMKAISGITDPEELVGFRGHEPILAVVTPAPPARSSGVSALSYAVALGDPATWTADEIEAQQNLAATEAAIPSPAVVTALPRAEKATLASAALQWGRAWATCRKS